MKTPLKPIEYKDKSLDDIMTQVSSMLSEKDDIIDKKSEVITWQKQRIELLEEYLRLSNHKRFGSSSEQTTAEQGRLFDEAEITAEPEQSELLPDPPQNNKSKRGRKPFDKKLPREQVFAYLSDAEKAGAIDSFFIKVREELDIVPAKVRVLEYMQEKAVFKTDEGGREFKVADVKKHPLPKAMGSVNLITYVIVSKYADGLPLYRIEKQLKRYGGDITRATLANWVISLSKQLQSLINLLREHQHSGPLIMMDETRVQVLKEPGYSATGDKWMWVSLGGLEDQQSVLFDYAPSRSGQVAARLLDGFNDGYLQSDGYSAYPAVCENNNLISVGCWDHARRKFKEAQQAQPKKGKSKVSRADMALSYINKLYLVERDIKNQSPEQIFQVRQNKSIPILEGVDL
ncbi:IS66 family transposase [Algibacillus agarilyticus]|uniref:IS66 family transposase n=1 Tax=Algibacillus agarilyticus TaxID=2234133 RepID=UPI0013007051|nr:IS66 family transposase [Algibacillus agarilyticus]